MPQQFDGHIMEQTFHLGVTQLVLFHGNSEHNAAQTALSRMWVWFESSLIVAQSVMLFTEQVPPPVDKMLSSLQLELTVPYSRLLLPSQAELPSTCLALAALDTLARWYIFGDAEELRQTRADLTRLIQVSRERRGVIVPVLINRSLTQSVWEEGEVS